MKDQKLGNEVVPQQGTESDKETGRVEAFSDGVFAIAITLLVLDVKVPRFESLGEGGTLVNALLKQWPSYLAFGSSFLVILIMWVNHHNLMKVIKRTDHNFLLLNGLLLMWITLVPFPTALISEYLLQPEGTVAAALYSGLSVLIALSYNLLWFYSVGNNRLLDKKSDMQLAGSITRRYVLGPLFYLIAFAMAFVSAGVSVAICIALAIYFTIPNRTAADLLGGRDG